MRTAHGFPHSGHGRRGFLEAPWRGGAEAGAVASGCARPAASLPLKVQRLGRRRAAQGQSRAAQRQRLPPCCCCRPLRLGRLPRCPRRLGRLCRPRRRSRHQRSQRHLPPPHLHVEPRPWPRPSAAAAASPSCAAPPPRLALCRLGSHRPQPCPQQPLPPPPPCARADRRQSPTSALTARSYRHRVTERPQLPAAPVPLRVLDDRAVTAARARASAHRPASPNLGRRRDHVGGGGSLGQQRPSTALLKPSSSAAHRAERCRGMSGARRHVSASRRHLCTARGRATRETGRATRELGRASGASSGHLGDADSGGEGARAAVARFRALGRS